MSLRTSALLCALIFWGSSCSKSSDAPDQVSEKPAKLEIHNPDDKSKANVVNLHQISLQEHEDVFRIADFGSGHDFYRQEEPIFPLVDILIVIDNSGSMGEEQAKLSQKMQPLISELMYVDWQINVISTDSPCPTKDYLPLKSTNGDPEVKNKFRDAISIGIDGSATERPLLMAKMNLTGQSLDGCTQKAWLREDASLVVFFLTDEDERSDSVEPSNENADTIIEFLTAPAPDGLEKKIGKTAKLYSIHSLPQRPCASAGFEPSKIIADLIEKTGGIAGDICASDYTNMLSTISEDIANLFRVTIPLKYTPANGTVVAMLDGEVYGKEFWKVEGSYFILLSALRPGEEIHVFYKKGVITDLVLRAKETPEAVKVFWAEPGQEAEEVGENDHTYFPGKKQVHFDQPLKPGLVVTVKYKNESELPMDFNFPVLESAEGIYCYGEDGALLSHTYYPGDNAILFDKAPAEGSKFTCLYP